MAACWRAKRPCCGDAAEPLEKGQIFCRTPYLFLALAELLVSLQLGPMAVLCAVWLPAEPYPESDHRYRSAVVPLASDSQDVWDNRLEGFAQGFLTGNWTGDFARLFRDSHLDIGAHSDSSGTLAEKSVSRASVAAGFTGRRTGPSIRRLI